MIQYTQRISLIVACVSALSLAAASVVAGLWVRSESGRFTDLIAWYTTTDGNGWQWGATVAARRGYIAAWGGRSQSDFKHTPGWTILFRRDESSYIIDEGSGRPCFFGFTHRFTEGTTPGNGFGASPRPYTSRYIAVSSPCS